MSAHNIAIARSLIVLLFLSVSFFGWGKLASIFLRLGRSTPIAVIPSLWLGWAFSLLIFRIVHMFFPLTAVVVIPIFLVGVVLTLPHLPFVIRSYFQENSFFFIILSLSALLIVAVWTATRAMLPVHTYDAGLYYLNLVRWINSYPLVPGLGNLHGRFAFNQSFFTYVGALNFYPFFVHGNAFANSFLFLLTLTTIANFLRPVIYKLSLLIDSHPFRYLPAVFALPILIYLVFSNNGPVLPAPDITSALLQLTMFVMLLRCLAVWKEDNKWVESEVIVLAILAVTTVTIKLSNLAFSAVIICFCLAYFWHLSNNGFRNLTRILLPCTLIFLVHGFHGYILSGAPLYPSTIGYLPLKWAVPYELVVNEANWVYSWARQPNTHWSNVLGNWNWFKPWLAGVWEFLFVDVVYPLISAFSLSGLGILTVLFSRKKGYRWRYWEWTILTPMVMGLFYWFFTAPNPRFAGSLFWLLSLGSALLLIRSLQPLLKKQVYIVAVLFIFIAANFNYGQFIYTHSDRLEITSKKGWHASKTVPLVEKQTSNGLIIYSPETGDQCWDSPIPCTPYFNADLLQFDPADLGSGFYVEKPQ